MKSSGMASLFAYASVHPMLRVLAFLCVSLFVLSTREAQLLRVRVPTATTTNMHTLAIVYVRDYSEPSQ